LGSPLVFYSTDVEVCRFYLMVLLSFEALTAQHPAITEAPHARQRSTYEDMLHGKPALAAIACGGGSMMLEDDAYLVDADARPAMPAVEENDGPQESSSEERGAS